MIEPEKLETGSLCLIKLNSQAVLYRSLELNETIRSCPPAKSLVGIFIKKEETGTYPYIFYIENGFMFCGPGEIVKELK